MVLRNFKPDTDVVSMRDQLIGIAVLATAGVVLWPLANGLVSFPIFVIAIVWALCLVVVFGVFRTLMLAVLAVVFGLVALVSMAADLPRRLELLCDKLRDWWKDPVRRGLSANRQLSLQAMRRWPAYYD